MTGGRLAGRRLRSLSGNAVRPTSDRVRESLFAGLGSLDGACVLDLYAGTGALGIEALSRGAESLVCVERAARPSALLRANLEALDLLGAARVLRGDACRVVARLGRAGARFDLVLLDPPYASGELPRALAALVAAGVLARGARIVAETSRHWGVPEVPGLECVAERRYGDTLVARLEAARTEPEGESPQP